MIRVRIYRVQHIQCNNVTSMTQRQETLIMSWPPNTPGAQEAEDDIQQQTPTPENPTQGLGEQMHSGNEATQRWTLYNIHSAATWRRWHNDKKLWSDLAHRIHLALKKLRMTFSSRPTHRRTVLNDYENKCIVATKRHRGVTKTNLTNLKIPILWETRETKPSTWPSKVSFQSNFTIYGTQWWAFNHPVC